MIGRSCQTDNFYLYIDEIYEITRIDLQPRFFCIFEFYCSATLSSIY